MGTVKLTESQTRHTEWRLDFKGSTANVMLFILGSGIFAFGLALLYKVEPLTHQVSVHAKPYDVAVGSMITGGIAALLPIWFHILAPCWFKVHQERELDFSKIDGLVHFPTVLPPSPEGDDCEQEIPLGQYVLSETTFRFRPYERCLLTLPSTGENALSMEEGVFQWQKRKNDNLRKLFCSLELTRSPDGEFRNDKSMYRITFATGCFIDLPVLQKIEYSLEDKNEVYLGYPYVVTNNREETLYIGVDNTQIPALSAESVNAFLKGANSASRARRVTPTNRVIQFALWPIKKNSFDFATFDKQLYWICRTHQNLLLIVPCFKQLEEATFPCLIEEHGSYTYYRNKDAQWEAVICDHKACWNCAKLIDDQERYLKHVTETSSGTFCYEKDTLKKSLKVAVTQEGSNRYIQDGKRRLLLQQGDTYVSATLNFIREQMR